MIENKKILILSISAWNSAVGADTWPTLMGGLNPDNIASVSLREEPPDSLACNNYFVISENRVLKSIVKRKLKTGRKVDRCTNKDDNLDDLTKHNARYQKMSKRRGFFSLFAREIVWKLGKWKTKELDDFLKEFDPDVVLYSMDGYIHFNRICKYAAKKTRAKSVGFFVDDNFTYKQSARLGLKLFRFFQRRSLKKLAKQTDAFWAITDMTKKEADAFFGVNCKIVTKPLKKEAVYQDWDVSTPIQILYTGNLQIGRDKSLLKVVDALKEINRENTFFRLDVYTKTQLSDEVKEQLSCDFCTLRAPVPQSEVLNLQEQADILLFLEDIDGPDAKTARLSFSTKITDYLSSGKCIFAVGCMDTAPMQYFLSNQAAIIASTQKDMVKQLKDVLEDHDILKKYAKQACECGMKNHKKEAVLKTVRESIEQLL